MEESKEKLEKNIGERRGGKGEYWERERRRKRQKKSRRDLNKVDVRSL